MDVRTRIAWNLRRIRTQQRVTQENLAVDADVDRTYISGIERRDFNPTVDLLERLANALAVDVSELFVVPSAEDAEPKPLMPGRKPRK